MRWKPKVNLFLSWKARGRSKCSCILIMCFSYTNWENFDQDSHVIDLSGTFCLPLRIFLSYRYWLLLSLYIKILCCQICVSSRPSCCDNIYIYIYIYLHFPSRSLLCCCCIIYLCCDISLLSWLLCPDHCRCITCLCRNICLLPLSLSHNTNKVYSMTCALRQDSNHAT